MKGLVFLGLVGATIYGALVLSSDYLLLRDPAENALAGQSLGNQTIANCGRGALTFPLGNLKFSGIGAGPARRCACINVRFSQLSGNHRTTRWHSISAGRMGQGHLSC